MHRRNGEKKGEGRECRLSQEGSQDACCFSTICTIAGNKKKKKEKTPNSKSNSCCVVSLGLSQQPPYVMPASLLLSHTKVSKKLGTSLVNPQNAAMCPRTVSVGRVVSSTSPCMAICHCVY